MVAIRHTELSRSARSKASGLKAGGAVLARPSNGGWELKVVPQESAAKPIFARRWMRVEFS